MITVGPLITKAAHLPIIHQVADDVLMLNY
jgi:hypothetical protein